MTPKQMPRRDFLASLLAGIPVMALDWDAFPRGKRGAGATRAEGNAYDAVIIGAGLGGLSCGAAFARQGFRPLVLEKHTKPGGFYPIGESQEISDAFAGFIEAHGGKVMLRTAVDKILVKDGAAYGVKTADGREFTGKVVVSNANAPDTFRKMLDDPEPVKATLARMGKLSIGLSTFQVFLGLEKDLVGEIGLKDTEVFYNPGYDIEADYAAAVRGDFTDPGFGATLYDNLYEGYSPKGKNTLSLMTLQGYGPWEKYEADYFAGRKDAYRAEKNRRADILIDKAEKVLLPGLRRAIEIREVATPLTNVRYTANPRGAIYGWDQTLDNAGQNRFPMRTPVKGLYLAGAWTFPGGGYGACIPSGLLCFAEIMKTW